jgi:cysteine-rich repeat protein
MTKQSYLHWRPWRRPQVPSITRGTAPAPRARPSGAIWLRSSTGFAIAMTLAAIAAPSSSCWFASGTTLCERSGLRCNPGQVCALSQDVCIDPSGCGDGIVQGNEVCDNGDVRDGDGCSANCLSDESCGNGVVDSVAGETCDKGDTMDGDGCSAECRGELWERHPRPRGSLR